VQKNITPNKLAFFCSISISICLFFVLLFADIPYTKIFICSGIIFLASFLIIFNSLQNFFIERIKLIYKFIATKKDNYREEAFRKFVLPNSNIQALEKDVANWGNEQVEKEKQLALLIQNEMYRKDFLSNFGHEIKTPIFNVQGYLHTLKDGAMHDQNVREKFLEKACNGIDRLALLTKDLDIISNLESGSYVLQISKFNLHELLLSTLDELEILAKQKNIALSLINPSNSNISVFADKQKIGQVLFNIIENAIKYGTTNGYVHINVYIVDEATVLIEISDNGIGIESVEIDRVFERFFRTPTGRNHHSIGSGIGLAIVKHIIEVHNQKITCRSAVNVGTTFGFTLSRIAIS
jgi:two-component system, OmpR family, phosphate regulon sensor histidine kinase PhoR